MAACLRRQILQSTDRKVFLEETKENGFNVSVLPPDRNLRELVLGSAVLPEEDEPRICLRISAWLWLMGCMTSEFALILGLYTFKRKTASLASAHSRFSRLAGPEVTAVCTLYFTKCSATDSFLLYSIYYCFTCLEMETARALINGFKGCLLSL